MFLKIRYFFLVFFFIFSFFSSADLCEGTFGTRLYFEELARRQGIKDRKFHSRFVDPIAERELIPSWNEKPDDLPPLLRALLPPDTHFIKRQLQFPGTPSSVKMSEPGEALIVRAYYNYNKHNPNGSETKYRLGTNVTFSARALMDNMENPREDNWLVGRNARAAVLYLHGGGTSTTGAHSAANLISHLNKHKIDVVSLDLGWHGQGHREFFSFESEIKALSEFAQKYIPPNVPLFVWGHSWGGVFADKLMTMTDHSGFFFHSKLAGVIIMSTAVDSAPGKMTVAEKFEAFVERLHRAKETSEVVGNEKERGIYRNIIVDGKVSPLGNMVSSGSILQSEHSTPSHQGRLYVPGMMLVGIHDTLVYDAWKDLYHQRYDNLENITPSNRHYVDKGFVEVEHGKFEERPMGHLVGGFKVRPETGSGVIQYTTALSFMEQQLRLHPIRRAILKAVKGTEGKGASAEEVVNENADYQIRKKRIEYLPSLEAAREYVVNEMQNVPPETVDNIIRQINIAESSRKSLLPKINNKSRQVPFVDVVQNALNDLGFRGFLINYHHVKQGTNQRHMVVKDNLPIINDIKLLLNPFNTPLKRAFHLLRELSKEESSYDYKTLKKELELVISLGEKPRSPVSAQLLGDLRLLKAIIGNQFNDRDVLHQEAKDIIERNQNVFKNIDIDALVPTKKIKDEELLGFVLSYENDLNAVRAKLEEERIPEPARTEALRLKQELMVSRTIAEGKYIPSMQELAPLLVERSQRTVGRVKEVLEKIEEEVTKRLKLSEDREVFRSSLAESKIKRNELRKRVIKAIKTVKRGLEEVRANPPTTLLVEAERKSTEDLDKLIEAQDKMEDELTRYAAEMFLGAELKSANEIIDGYNSGYRGYVDNFTNLFREYSEKRKALDKKILMAIQKGEMSEEFQKAVTDLYGVSFDGKAVRESIYLELIEATHYVAMLEAALKENDMELMQATQKYDQKIGQLLNLLTTRRRTGADPNIVIEGEVNLDVEVVSNIPLNHPVLNRLKSAIGLYNYDNTSMASVLNGVRRVVEKGEDGQEREVNLVGNILIVDNGNIRRLNGGVPGRRKDTESHKEELIKYIKHHTGIFTAVLKDYRDAVDKREAQETLLPPELPLISLEEVLVNESRIDENND